MRVAFLSMTIYFAFFMKYLMWLFTFYTTNLNNFDTSFAFALVYMLADKCYFKTQLTLS